MSYELEYKRVAYFLEDKERPSSLGKEMFLLIQEGSNNCYEMQLNGRQRRERNWTFVSFGYNYSIIGEVCRRAGACEGGSLTIKGKEISPEAYIKKYRNVLARAKSFNDFKDDFHTREFIIYPKDEKDLGEWQLDALKELKDDKDFVRDEYKRYNGDVEVKYIINVTTEEDFRKVMKYSHLNKYSSPSLHLGDYS